MGPAEFYYKNRNDNNESVWESLIFIDTNNTNAFKGIGIARLTDSNFNIIDNTRLVYEGKRIIVDNSFSTFDYNQYIERGYIEYSKKDIAEFSSVYSDSGLSGVSDGTTGVPYNDFLILNGKGLFSGYNILRITYDNEGTASWNPHGQKRARKLNLLNK